MEGYYKPSDSYRGREDGDGYLMQWLTNSDDIRLNTITQTQHSDSYRGRKDGCGVQVNWQEVSQLCHENEMHSYSELLEGQVAITIHVRQFPAEKQEES